MNGKDSEWKPTRYSTERAREGFDITRRLLVEDFIKARFKNLGLPSDWGSRVIK